MTPQKGAMGYKDKGNVCIAASDSAGAAKHYERGIKIVSTLGTDEQAKALLLSLRLNLALACTKEERYFDAASAATKVLEVDAANVKALFRRGVARARLGSLEDAKSDLLAVVKADPRNGGAKKELKAVRDRLVEHRKKEKESYGGLFDKGPMYNDKEVERKKREAEALKRQKEEEEQWGKANEQRKADGKEEQTLEDWRKEKKEAEEKAKKEREEKERLKPRPPAIPVAPPKKASKKEGGGGDGDYQMELDEDDLKIIQDTKKQGYCYFKRTLSEQDQQLLNAEQMKLKTRVADPASIPEKKEADADAVRSAWNNAGTWEETEKTDWCKGKLTEAFSKVSVTVGKDARSDPEFLLEKLGGFDFASAAAGDGAGGGKGLEALGQLKQALSKLRASVTSVEIVEADARVICVSNKTKHLFEFNVKVKFSLTIDESMGLQPQAQEEGQAASKDAGLVKTYKATLEFLDMTNGDVDNGRFESEPELKWDKGSKWDSVYDDRVKTCVADLKAGLLSALGVFFVEYKSS
ncbi:conserved unknown protein [Ectocarpus siliculosus]|uniref:peptidylprolyl isomerase n=1 Tax=Ectocarpus siliculosus TaxID=2880 RepID=D7FZK9_ECTSI|nr:conserved unknown protein [Ectocarpus siliculosus]|eukprot:CBJ32816.1 conserved unknown protein [Ectocarpus siliculosus]